MMTLLELFGVLIAVHRVPGSAAAPMLKSQPGFYRMLLGNFQVTALNDGVVAYPTAKVLPTATSQEISRALTENGLEDPVKMSYNAS